MKPVKPDNILERIARHRMPSSDRNRRDSLAPRVVKRPDPEVIYRPDPRQWGPGDES